MASDPTKRSTESRGGSAAAGSVQPCLGSEFSVQLPDSVDIAAQPQQSGHCCDRPAPRGLRLLIADDNRDAANMLGMFLEKIGNEVRVVYDGAETLRIAESFHPDVVLMDIAMPVVGGCDAARTLREQRWAQSALLIAVTGWGREEDKRRSKDAGFDHHLVKPVELAELQKLLAQHRKKADDEPRCGNA